MWLRDRIPRDLPDARVFTYGYDTRLARSHSFQNLADVASTFCASLTSALQGTSVQRPLIFIIHSLGELVLKQTLVQMASGDAEDVRKLHATHGILLFGVPNHGMDISSLLAKVHTQPNLPFLPQLSKESGLLQPLIDSFRTLFDFDGTNELMSGECSVLVDRYSAKGGRSLEDNAAHLHPIDRT